jgi:hypothetical protein
MRRQEFIRGAEKNLGNSLRAGTPERSAQSHDLRMRGLLSAALREGGG